MGLSELISSIVRPLFDLLPRITARPATNEHAVIDSWLFGVSQFRGPRVYVPVMSHIEYYPKVEYPIDTGLQSLTSKCGKSVCINATAIVKVSDPVLLREKVGHEDWECWVSMIIRKHVRYGVVASDWKEFHADVFHEDVESYAGGEIETAGVELVQLVLEDTTEVIPVRLLQPSPE